MDQSSKRSPGTEQSPSELTELYCGDDAFCLKLLADEAESVILVRGQALLRQGDPSDSMYLLLRGRLAVRLEHEDGTETQLAELEPGTPVGELALLTGQPRTASVYALTDAELVRCSRASYERLAAEHPDELASFARTVARRLQEIQLVGVLASLFGIQDAQTMAWLRDELEWIHLRHGDVLFHEGDPSEAMYILVSGRICISASLPEDGQHILGEVSPGEVVGELGLLSGEPRSATALAIRETHLARMTLPVFERFVEHHPKAIMCLMRLIVKRQQRPLYVRPSSAVRALAFTLVPTTRDVPLVTFAEDLASHLGAQGSLLVLDSARLDQSLGRPGAAQAQADHPTGLVVSAWLSEQESRYRYLLYVADHDWSPWTERCVCQADRLLLLGDAQANPEPGPVEQAIGRRKLPVRQELILLHPESTHRPLGTANWLAKRDLHAHHHIRSGDQAQMKRLARRLAGQALGLVLSGGGARGFAHVGVLRAMEEQGLEIDLIGGTSMGALVGSVYAMGRKIDECVELAERLANPRRLFDYTLPLSSLMASKKVTRVIRELLEDICIEDLWRPFFCVSSNLSHAEAVIHRTGPLWQAVRASIAIPGIFTPILYGDDVLVDGGAMNNFPVDVMVELCEGGPVIGSNVSPLLENSDRYEFGPSINGWRVLWSRLNPFHPGMKVPSLLGCLMRAQEIRGVSGMRHAESLVDVMIRPDVSAFSIMDFAAYAPIMEIGYNVAREQLAVWSDTP